MAIITTFSGKMAAERKKLTHLKIKKPKNKSKTGWVALLVFLGLVFAALLMFWFSPFHGTRLNGMLNNQSLDEIYAQDKTLLGEILANLFKNTGSSTAVCGNDSQWTVLAVGIDERSGQYLYGLADVIRLARVDFENPHINVIAFPRATLVNPPQGLPQINPPMLLNQAYFFGSPGMNYFQGSGYGAGALAATIKENFGIESDHYLVIDFQAFVEFIDAIGGIEVDLPTYVDDLPSSYFPAGKQTLNGAQALTLARVRSKYSDLIRIDNQTLILKAVFARLKNPAILLKLPKIYSSLSDSFQSDASPAQIPSVLCLLRKLDAGDIQFFTPPEDLLVHDWEFIPNMSQQMEIFRWDQRLPEWIEQSLDTSG